MLFPTFDPDLVLDAMKKSPATVYCAVPPIYERTAMAAKERGRLAAVVRSTASPAP